MKSRRTFLRSATAVAALSFALPNGALANEKLPVIATFKATAGEHCATKTVEVTREKAKLHRKIFMVRICAI